MDRNHQLIYEKDFRIKFLELKGEAFQRLFETLMGKVYPGDFMSCSPWGNMGDQKNDGYLPSKRMLFQVYAPNEMESNKAIKKINADFVGAKEHWQEYFDEWVFVYNTPDGRLSPPIIKAFCTLKAENAEIKISHWGYEELLIQFRKLDLNMLESWFGASLTFESLGYSDLAAVLNHIKSKTIPVASKIKEVSSGKIEANLLSLEVAAFLKLGMHKSLLVEAFFNQYHDPLYGEQIAAEFKKKYIELKDTNPKLHPDQIFGKIENWARGAVNSDPKHNAAVLAVIAYLFDKCEIFEDAREYNAI